MNYLDNWITTLDVIIREQGLLLCIDHLADATLSMALKTDHQTYTKLRSVEQTLREASAVLMSDT